MSYNNSIYDDGVSYRDPDFYISSCAIIRISNKNSNEKWTFSLMLPQTQNETRPTLDADKPSATLDP